MRIKHAAIGVFGLSLAACGGEPVPHNTGVYMLIDTSGTYTEEITQAQQIINVILSRLEPADAFAVARVDTGSFSERDIVAKVQFDDRPSVANQQKRRFQEQVDTFVEAVKPSAYTDITGGVLQASEFLTEKGAGRKLIFIFSDLAEDLPEGYVRDIPFSLDGFEVIALNVTKLRTDNIDPREYMDRLEAWRAKVEEGGGVWRVINDVERLDLMWR
ncbi:MAG: VWA domain-containing protein [Pseudomonadota bacterium]